MPLGVDNLLLLTEESRKQMYDAARRAPEGTVVQQLASGQLPTALEKKEKRWRIGGMEFEALMRMLDNAVSILNLWETELVSWLEYYLRSIIFYYFLPIF